MACESLRVCQVDASILDEEYKRIALAEVNSTIEQFPFAITRKLEKVKPEIALLVDSCLWTTRFTQGASPGQLEEDIAFKEYDQKKVVIHYCCSILLPYLANRCSSLTNNNRTERVIRKIEAILEMFSVFHHLRFLSKGGHSTITESLLGLRNWNNNIPTLGTINYESQNRELLWHAFRDGLLLAWPFGSFAHRYWTRWTQSSIEKTDVDDSICGVCTKTAVIPVVWNQCGHMACYWCDSSRREFKNKCAICNKEGTATWVFGRKTK